MRGECRVQTSIIFDKIPLGIIVFDETNDIISINDLGEEFFAKTCDYLQHIIQEMVKSTLDNHESVQKIIRFSANNDFFIWNIKTEFIKVPSPQIAVIIEDKTINSKLEQTILKAEKLAVIGHLAIGSLLEIRNPLTSAIGFCQLIEDDDKVKKDYLEIISRELEQIQGIIENYAAVSEYSVSRCIDSIYQKFWTCIHSKVISCKLIMVTDAYDDILINKISDEQISNTLKYIKSLDIWVEEGIYVINFDINEESGSLIINFGSMDRIHRDIYAPSNLDQTINRHKINNSQMNIQVVNNESININLVIS